MSDNVQDIEKRNFLKAMLFSTFLPLMSISEAETKDFSFLNTPVNIIIPKEYDPSLDPSNQYRLTQATLSYIEENYRDGNIPLWGKKFKEVNFEKRIGNIVLLICAGIKTYQDIYPIDPTWVVAQIMIESLFYEFAVSRSLAVGICQFIQPTAHEYGMVCAGDLPEHTKTPYQLPEFAEKTKEYYQLKHEKKQYQQQPHDLLSLEESLKIILRDDCSGQKEKAQNHFKYLKKGEEFDKKISKTQKEYRKYIEINTKGKDIFDDTGFIERFDERLTHQKPVMAMVKMLAEHLQARNGNILAAAAGYNAGLSRTQDKWIYKPYGKIPYIRETVDYLSHLLINHYEITARINRMSL